MNARRINLALWSATTVLGGVAVMAIAWALLTPLNVPAQHDVSATSAGVPKPTSSPLAFADLSTMDRPLRQPLSETAPAIAEQSAGSAASPSGSGPFVLAGTIGDSLAMFRMADGSIAVKGVGEQIDGAQVLAIRQGQAEVLLKGARTVMGKTKPSAAPGEAQADGGH